MRPLKFALFALMGIVSAQAALAETTTLTFDEFSHRTVITTQYQPVGVTVDGVESYLAGLTQWPAQSGQYTAYTELGLMTFTIDSAIAGEIREVSVFISGDTIVTMKAFDAAGNLLGTVATTTADNTNTLLNLGSAEAPIAKVTLDNGGTVFYADTLVLATAAEEPPPVVCADVAARMNLEIAAVPAADFKHENKRRQLIREGNDFARLVAADVPDFRLRDQLWQIQRIILNNVVDSEARRKLLQTVEELLRMVEAQQC